MADVFTALTEERPYRRGMSGREAAGILGSMAAGGALDPDVVALVARNRGEAAVIRRLAQEGASGRYLAFREQAFERRRAQGYRRLMPARVEGRRQVPRREERR